jgi:hypothetical protein
MNGGGSVIRFSESAPRPPVFPGMIQLVAFVCAYYIHSNVVAFLIQVKKMCRQVR